MLTTKNNKIKNILHIGSWFNPPSPLKSVNEKEKEETHCLNKISGCVGGSDTTFTPLYINIVEDDIHVR